MEIETIPIENLNPYERNPRMNDEAVPLVAESIREFGFLVPIVIDADGVIVAGHTRLKAAKSLGITEVPCIRASHLTPEQVKAFRLADNRTAEEAMWDVDMLFSELEGLDLAMDAFGFTEGWLDDLTVDWGEDTEQGTGEESGPVEEDEPPKLEEVETVTQPGDIWILGNHRLMCGDSTDKACVERLMDGEKADLVVTDPPYNVAYEGKTKDALTIQNDSMDADAFRGFLTDAFHRCFESLREGGAFYVWYASREHVNFETALNNAGLQVRQQLIWKKNVMVLGRQDYQWKHEPCLYGWKDGASHSWYSDRSQTTVLEFDKPVRNAEHPTMKPIELIAYQIKNSSKRGDVVLDLFGCSGSTLIACEQLDRNCFMMELDPIYCDVIVARWEKFTGLKAERVTP